MSQFLSILIDVVLVLLFVLIIVRFTKYGFSETINKIGKTWSSLICTIVISPFVSEKLQSWFLTDALTKGFNNALVSVVENNPNGYSIKELFENLPQGILHLFESYNVNIPELEAVYGSASVANPELLQEIAQRIAVPCSEMIAGWVGQIACFFLSLLFFKWLEVKISHNRRVPFFRHVDRCSGFFIGIVVGYIAVWASTLLINTTFEVIIAFDANSMVVDIYRGSYIHRFVSEFDMIGVLVNLFDTVITWVKSW